jgi:DNA-binding MurR/RpiR family transcriptional regulator
MIRDLVKSMEVARDSGAKTVAITAGIDSPMTKLADAVLYCGTTTKGPSYLVTNRIGELVIVDILYKLLMLKTGPEIKPHFESLSEVLKPKRF